MVELVKYSAKHRADIVMILNNENVAKWLLSPPFPYTEKDADYFLDKCSQINENGISVHFAVEKEGRMIGGTGLKKAKDGKTEVGYYIAEEHWNKGYGTEVLNRMLGIGFANPEINEIYAEVFEGNAASERIILKCGFRFLRESGPLTKNGIVHKARLFVISKTEYDSIRK
ncbi:MAG: GNAT family N-acetyltransferase [Bacteroidetes bacterium]|nr:GNAT family N-acetyltransferase [Bacteroidota bacterium]